MKKSGSSIVIFVVLAQLLWLGAHFLLSKNELDRAPRISVKAVCNGSDIRPMPVRKSYAPDDPFFGKSLWWDAMNEKIHSRPTPGPKVKGAMKLSYTDSLAGFWRKGKDGLWQLVRVEAPDSSEDKAREGEIRLCVRSQSIVHIDETILFEPETHAIGERHVTYNLVGFPRKVCRMLSSINRDSEEAPLVMTLALRNDKSPVAVGVTYKGEDLADVARKLANNPSEEGCSREEPEPSCSSCDAERAGEENAKEAQPTDAPAADCGACNGEASPEPTADSTPAPEPPPAATPAQEPEPASAPAPAPEESPQPQA